MKQDQSFVGNLQSGCPRGEVFRAPLPALPLTSTAGLPPALCPCHRRRRATVWVSLWLCVNSVVRRLHHSAVPSGARAPLLLLEWAWSCTLLYEVQMLWSCPCQSHSVRRHSLDVYLVLRTRSSAGTWAEIGDAAPGLELLPPSVGEAACKQMIRAHCN